MFSQLIKTDDDLRQTPHLPFIFYDNRNFTFLLHKCNYASVFALRARQAASFLYKQLVLIELKMVTWHVVQNNHPLI